MMRATQCSSVAESEAENTWSRRRAILQGAGAALVLLGGQQPTIAEVGTLPELQDANLIVQGVTIRVADKSQQAAMIKFLQDGFDFKILRRRINGSVEEIWLGFGPEQLSIPPDFTVPVSSFYEYGGHASIHLVYDSKSTSVLYNIGDPAPGNNIAYLQVGVPTYRITQMVKTGGNILDAYGIVNVVTPSGLPMRGIVGISPDPIMFVAINCADVKQSTAFYEQLGFAQQEYPFCRPNKGTGVFEPPQPKGSVYLAPTANGMGILLLPTKRKRQVQVNPVMDGLNIVYKSGVISPSESTVDPSGVSLRYQSVQQFEDEERLTR